MIFLIDMNVEEPTAEEIQRVIQACQLKTHEYELVNQIWDYALKDHYEYSYGMFWYESYADFKEAHGSETQQERILSNFGCLKHLESIYDSSQRFFIMKDTDNLEKYYLLGNFEVTDEDLKNAYSCIIG